MATATSSVPNETGDTGVVFIAYARSYLSKDYLPKIERCLADLTDSDLWWRYNPESNTIANLLLHLSGNVRQWIVSGVGGAPDMRIRQQEFDADNSVEAYSRSELLTRLKLALNDADNIMAGLTPADLLSIRQIQGYDVTVLEAIFHVVEHFSMHTGQIIYMTKALTARDLQFYDL